MEEIFDPAVYGGLLLYAAGKPEGYAVWELLGGKTAGGGETAERGGPAAEHSGTAESGGPASPEQAGGTAYVYFAKANITNFNVYLYYSMAKDFLRGVEFLNNGYDMGKSGLRTFKRHLSVHRMMKKYLVTL
jgi:hypothetical protein